MNDTISVTADLTNIYYKTFTRCFRKVIHRVQYIIERYVQHEKLKKSGVDGMEDFAETYDYHEIDFPVGTEDFEINVSFYRSYCGDTDWVSGFVITPMMIQNPEQELAKVFQERMAKAKKRELDKEWADTVEATHRQAIREDQDREDYERLKKRFETGQVKIPTKGIK